MTFLSIATGCFNEEGNVAELHESLCKTFADDLPEYAFELIFIDNASTDKMVEIRKSIASAAKRGFLVCLGTFRGNFLITRVCLPKILSRNLL